MPELLIVQGSDAVKIKTINNSNKKNLGRV
jgi:hypothetical protein